MKTTGDVLAAIDVGSNAMRLEVAALSEGNWSTLERKRDAVRPGEGVFTTGSVSPAAVERIIDRLRDYAAICDGYGARVRAVATSALREAANRNEIVARARDEAGIALEVISGREEARLVCLGVLSGTPEMTTSLCIDVGGGSTEVALAYGEQPTHLWSLGIGALRLSDLHDEGPWGVLGGMRAQVARTIGVLPRGFATLEIQQALGCSGTMRALIAFATDGERTFATVDELSAALARLLEMGPAGRRRHFDAPRAEVIVAGAVIAEGVARHLGLASIQSTSRGLRDGVLLDLARGDRPARMDRGWRDAAVGLTATQRP